MEMFIKTSSIKEIKVQKALGTLDDEKLKVLLENLNFLGRLNLLLWVLPDNIKIVWSVLWGTQKLFICPSAFHE